MVTLIAQKMPVTGLTIIGKNLDLRTNTPVVYATIPISEYIELVGSDFDRFGIQRRREEHKAYKRMRTDIANGALLPSITLSINPDIVNDYKNFFRLESDEMDNLLIEKLKTSDNIFIVDGLQRTYIISDLVRSGDSLIHNQRLLLEFWLESELKHLIYRFIVLNSGQKSMSLKHQIDLLFMNIHTKINNSVPGINLILEKDDDSRDSPKQYVFDRIVTAFYCFNTKTPEIQRDSIIVQGLDEMIFSDSDENVIFGKFNFFIRFLILYSEIDELTFNHYSRETNENRSKRNIFADESVIRAFFAAVGAVLDIPNGSNRIENALDRLKNNISRATTGDDPLALAQLARIREAINPRKQNVGVASRKLISSGFKEFFKDEGQVSIDVCWRIAAE